MPAYHDALGDELKRIETDEAGRGPAPGDAVVVRVDGVGFSKFTRGFERPFDSRIAAAMDAATVAVVDRLHPVIAYTQSDEISFVFFDDEQPVAYDGRYHKLASVCASLATGAFLRAGLRLFPERLENVTPIFDGRAVGMSRELAARTVEWREIDARRNSVSMAAHSVFGSHGIHARNSADMKDMLRAEVFEMSDYPERFLRGAFFRREKIHSVRSQEDLDRIPEAYRAAAAAVKHRTMTIQLTGLPPLSVIENLEEFIFEGDDPVAASRPFARSVTS